jgi:hypothetical protein
LASSTSYSASESADMAAARAGRCFSACARGAPARET